MQLTIMIWVLFVLGALSCFCCGGELLFGNDVVNEKKVGPNLSLKPRRFRAELSLIIAAALGAAMMVVAIWLKATLAWL